MGEESVLSQEALSYIKREKRRLLARFANPDVHKSSERPISLFMAGSPGAGKTEVSKRLVETFTEGIPVRIDADEIREICPGYSGANAHLFQAAATKGVQMLYDHVLKKHLHAIMDTTFQYAGALDNVQRSLDKQRTVAIYYLYQDPIIAWDFTKKREATESRRVSLDDFVGALLRARENVRAAKERFDDRITIHVMLRNFNVRTDEIHRDATVEGIDRLIPVQYTAEQLKSQLQMNQL